MKQDEGLSGGIFAWIKAKWRTGVDPKGSTPVRGFGPKGEYTLWLPSTEAKRVIEFKSGKAEFQIVGKTANDEELNKLRMDIIKSYSAISIGGMAYLPIDSHLLNYSASLILRNYDMSDEDLTMLHTGTNWVEPICIHALGGEESRNALARSNIAAAELANRRREAPRGPVAETVEGKTVELNPDQSLNPVEPFDLSSD